MSGRFHQIVSVLKCLTVTLERKIEVGDRRKKRICFFCLFVCCCCFFVCLFVVFFFFVVFLFLFLWGFFFLFFCFFFFLGGGGGVGETERCIKKESRVGEELENLDGERQSEV